ncbi:MAG TPA: hypothetical protein VFG68_16440 [Fimbriiglobus sp.]|nr:hypothetical protein [Fimbriiglobus sp.]
MRTTHELRIAHAGSRWKQIAAPRWTVVIRDFASFGDEVWVIFDGHETQVRTREYAGPDRRCDTWAGFLARHDPQTLTGDET